MRSLLALATIQMPDKTTLSLPFGSNAKLRCHAVKCDTLGSTVAGPKLRNSIPLARLEVRKGIPLRVAHSQVPLLWKNPPCALQLKQIEAKSYHFCTKIKRKDEGSFAREVFFVFQVIR